MFKDFQQSGISWLILKNLPGKGDFFIFIWEFYIIFFNIIKLKTAGLPVVFNRLTEPRTSGVDPSAHRTYKFFSRFRSCYPQKAKRIFYGERAKARCRPARQSTI